MNINIRPEGDDLLENRLFSYLSNEMNTEIRKISQLRGNVFLVQLPDSNLILKGFNDLRKLKIQEIFSASLHKRGFQQSSKFHSLNSQPFFFQNQYFGCLEYIDPHPEPFHYEKGNDRREGLELLQSFHNATESLTGSYITLLPKADLSIKWSARKNEFVNNLSRIHVHISKFLTSDLIAWADFSLAGFIRLKKLMHRERPVILHGDVAHHNFLRGKDGKLYLIDYDLISIGPRMYDLLQYANRILPFLNWRLELLEAIPPFKIMLRNEAFLYGLLYPSDLMREWNRLLRGQQRLTPYRLAPMIEMTENQFYERKVFSENLIYMLK